LAGNVLGLLDDGEIANFLNNWHDEIPLSKLNDYCVQIIDQVNKHIWVRMVYYILAKDFLSTILGDGLVMQFRLNLRFNCLARKVLSFQSTQIRGLESLQVLFPTLWGVDCMDERVCP